MCFSAIVFQKFRIASVGAVKAADPIGNISKTDRRSTCARDATAKLNVSLLKSLRIRRLANYM